MRLYVIATPSV
uniref:Uncharacterized protein n=1 Tax=Anguilla anguilla TaxID=7936 RepID=A0A0E9VMJ4_ANGAN